jgi:hypothetical protein
MPIKHARMRTDRDKHPLLADYQFSKGGKYPTRLKDGMEMSNHDDWDCLDDMEAEGLIEVISLVNGLIKFTQRGKKVAAALRAHKMDGGSFGNFEYKKKNNV